MRLLKAQENQTFTIHGEEIKADARGLILPVDEKSRLALLGLGCKNVADKTLTRNPDAADDIRAGFEVGTITHNTAAGTAFVCLEDATGKAVHEKITSTVDAHEKLGLIESEKKEEPKPDQDVLLGSSTQPSEFKLESGAMLGLGDVVNMAFKNSRLKTAKEWNDLDDVKRENFIQAAVDSLDLAKPEHHEGA